MTTYDVVVIGEVLLEIASTEPFRGGGTATIGISGDALNAAAAAAAAGAAVGLITVVPTDGLGDAVEARIRELGVATALLRRRRGPQGMYLVHSDPDGQREFMYARTASVGSTLYPADLDGAGLESAGAVLTSGITAAISDSARLAVLEAARRARQFVYDPNFRPALTTSRQATEILEALTPLAALIAPSFPTDVALLGLDDPAAAVSALLAGGAQRVAVTCGADGAVVGDGSGVLRVPAYPALAVVDQTGAGDSFTGSLIARLVLGDDLHSAAHYAAAAAALSVSGRGGTGFVPDTAAVAAHLSKHAAQTISELRACESRLRSS